MRVVSHTCSNTEIVCALGAQDLLIAVDNDSDYPPDVVSKLVPLGRDLQLDVDAALALKPDLVMTSLPVPGHERIVAAVEQPGVPTVEIGRSACRERVWRCVLISRGAVALIKKN